MKEIITLLCLITVCFASCLSDDDTETGKKYPAPDKLCALTFDDGPDSTLTPLVLDKLETHGVVATFFVIGQLINDSTAPVMVRAIKLGCEIGNHSWAWDSMDDMTAEQIRESVEMTTAKIEEYTRTTPRFFRPPNLRTSDTMYEIIKMPFASGVLGFDWAGCDTMAEDRAQNILSNIKDGSIILLHDVQPPPHPTPEALDILIPELKKQGYEFVTLSELFSRKGIPLDSDGNNLWVYTE
ncbi:MAG: polysaccharide deacetylase family protein [Spirochaetales bacterium]|nr:polysaccharide deacetylase family protein [Spirochaetales bacterium]